MAQRAERDVIVIGGGFFGCYLSCELALRGWRVSLLEREGSLMSRASYNNQARVHNGYHYARHFRTALRSRISFPRFIADFPESIRSDFTKLYAVAGPFSKTTSLQYENFMAKVGSPLEPAPAKLKKLFSPKLIEEVYIAQEFAFDAMILRDTMIRRLADAGVEVVLDASVSKVAPCDGGIMTEVIKQGDVSTLVSPRVMNCTYSGLNELLAASGLEMLPLKHELTEMCLVEPPESLHGIAITIMCGPFFSLMPFPPKGLSTLSHVRYTPHFGWRDDDPDADRLRTAAKSVMPSSTFPAMVRDASRYVPEVGRSNHVGSLWEIKTTLGASEGNDGRPILFKRNHGLVGFDCILGGKIDNVYDLVGEIEDKKGLGGEVACDA